MFKHDSLFIYLENKDKHSLAEEQNNKKISNHSYFLSFIGTVYIRIKNVIKSPFSQNYCISVFSKIGRLALWGRVI